MSSNTNNLSVIIRKLIVRAQEEALTNTENVTMTDEAIAAVLALLPEKLKLVKSHPEEHRRAVVGYNEAIDQTRRNLIGEQPGDSDGLSGGSEPLSNQVMPIVSESGKPEIIQSPMYGIVADIVKNNKNLTKDLQNAIARFIEIEATPRYQVNVTTAASEGSDTKSDPFENAYVG